MITTDSRTSSVRVRPMTGSIGAELEGLDLTRALDAATRNAVLAAFERHQVIVIRDQPLTPEQHLAFSAVFGPCMDLPHIPRVAGHELLHEVKREPSAGNRRVPGERWHADSTFLKEPPGAVVMRAVDVPEYGGDTLFTSMYAAFDALSEAMQRMLRPLDAVHSATRVFGKESLKREPILQLRAGLSVEEGETETEHPIVCRHARSQREHLFVNVTYTQRIHGMSDEESRPLINFLCEHATRPEFGCRVRWRNDTVVVWDNRCTMHRAVPDFLESFRSLQRTTVAAPAPGR